jgi:hypothetical protein
MRAKEFISEGDQASALQKVANIIKGEATKPNAQQFVLDKLMRLTGNHDENKIMQIINKACQSILKFPDVQSYANSIKAA